MRTTCRCCGAIIFRTTRSGRYAWTDNVAGSDWLGSGSECPKSETGHDPSCRICGGTDGRHDGATHDARVADLPADHFRVRSFATDGDR